MSGKQILGLCTVLVAVIGVPTAFFGMIRGCNDVGKSAAERRKAEEELERLRREKEAAPPASGGTAQVRPIQEGGSSVAQPKVPAAGGVVEPKADLPPPKAQPVPKSTFFAGSIVVVDGPWKGHRFVIAEATSKQQFTDRIRLQFRDPSGEPRAGGGFAIVEVTFLCTRGGLVEVGKSPDSRGWATLKWVPGE